MITLNITRAGDPEGVYLKLPSSASEIDETFALLDAISPDVSTTAITEVLSNIYNLGDYIKNTSIEHRTELDKINCLAEKIRLWDTESCWKFEGMLDANSVSSIDDVLSLADKLGEYALLPDAGNNSALGRYLVEHNVVPFPENVYPYLNYSVIGLEFYTNHGGAYCRGGYAVRQEELPLQLRQLQNREKRTMTLELRGKDGVCQTLDLPTTKEHMAQVRQQLGVEGFGQARIGSVEYVFPYLGLLIPQDHINVEEADKLAHIIDEMHREEGGLLKYLATLTVIEPATFHEALQLAMEQSNYERVPSEPENYAKHMLRRLGANQELLDAIDGYLDYSALGQAAMEDDGVKKTEFGSIRCKSHPLTDLDWGVMEMQ